MTGKQSGDFRRAPGAYVIPWTDVLVEGAGNCPLAELSIGQELVLAEWPHRLDVPAGRLRLEGGDGVEELHARAARIARMLAGVVAAPVAPLPEPDDQLLKGGLVLTDGRTSYGCAVVEGRVPLLVFHGRCPAPRDRLWIVRLDGAFPLRTGGVDQPAVVCFAAGTPVATPAGARPIETLQPGDMVLTRDHGAMPVRWRGQRTISAAQLIAEPHLRPVRIRSGALGIDRPDGDVLLSPDHRVLVSGPAAATLFGVREVLVRAGDLLDADGVVRDRTPAKVTYVHLALDGHQVLDASGLPVESFDPSSADLSALRDADRAALLERFPGLRSAPGTFGPPARRVLRTSEAAILGHRLN